MPRPSKASLTLRKTPVQTRSSVTFEAILTAAIQVLLKQGYAKFTTARVADRAGVSVGSLYQYFPNKQALIREIVRRHVQRLTDAICEVALDTTRTPGEVLQRAVEAFFRAKLQNLPISIALRVPMTEVGYSDIVFELMTRVTQAVQQQVRRQYPELSAEHALLKAAVMVTALNGVSSSVLEQDPQKLKDPVLQNEALLLLQSYFRA